MAVFVTPSHALPFSYEHAHTQRFTNTHVKRIISAATSVSRTTQSRVMRVPVQQASRILLRLLAETVSSSILVMFVCCGLLQQLLCVVAAMLIVAVITSVCSCSRSHV